MELLPEEIREQIVQYLDRQSLKSLRLASKIWARIGEEYLIPHTFVTLSQRDDFSRLLNISQHKLSYKIKSLQINLGQITEYNARHNAYSLRYLRDSDSRMAALEEIRLACANLKALTEQFRPQSCSVDLLTTAFSSLHNLKSITVSLNNCPFHEEDYPSILQEIWAIPTTRHFPSIETIQNFTSILSAISASASTLSIETLSHDWLPFEFFRLEVPLASSFKCLTSLSLTLDYYTIGELLHETQGLENLSHYLRSASSLQSLSLAFHGQRSISISPLLSSFRQHHHSFPKLQSLKFEGMNSTEIELGDFLVQQKALRRLQLGGLGPVYPMGAEGGSVILQMGSFQALFRRIGLEMQLDCFEVMGTLFAIQTSEVWALQVPTSVEKLMEGR